MAKIDLLICAAALVLCAGCFSIERAVLSPEIGTAASVGKGTTSKEHVLVSNYGWYLFNRVPLVCGNARKGAFFPWVFFRNDVDETKLQDRFTGYASAIGCDLDDLVMFNSEQVLLDIYSIPVPIPYVCCYREMQISGVLVKRPTAADAAAARAEAMKREMKELLKKVPAEEGR